MQLINIWVKKNVYGKQRKFFITALLADNDEKLNYLLGFYMNY